MVNHAMLRINVNLPDSYRPLVEARRIALKRSSDSHYGRCLIEEDLGIAVINHRALAAAAELAADGHARPRSKARRHLPKS